MWRRRLHRGRARALAQTQLHCGVARSDVAPPARRPIAAGPRRPIKRPTTGSFAAARRAPPPPSGVGERHLGESSCTNGGHDVLSNAAGRDSDVCRSRHADPTRRRTRCPSGCVTLVDGGVVRRQRPKPDGGSTKEVARATRRRTEDRHRNESLAGEGWSARFRRLVAVAVAVLVSSFDADVGGPGASLPDRL